LPDWSCFEGPRNCESEVRSDLKDLEDDERMLAAKDQRDTTFVRKERPCPMPGMCSTECRVCRECNRKLGVHPQTELLQSLAQMMSGGLRVDPDELSAVQWSLLGTMRGKSAPW
jgi:hypothetical protein